MHSMTGWRMRRTPTRAVIHRAATRCCDGSLSCSRSANASSRNIRDIACRPIERPDKERFRMHPFTMTAGRAVLALGKIPIRINSCREQKLHG